MVRRVPPKPETRVPRRLHGKRFAAIGLVGVLIVGVVGLVVWRSLSTAGQAARSGVCTTDDLRVAGGSLERPRITIPQTCEPPHTLLAKDLLVGYGTATTSTSRLRAHYLVMAWSERKAVDSSWGHEPFEVDNLVGSGVIAGWKAGLIGTRPGGRRLLIVPPELGYGASGAPGVKPNETLVFVVDIVTVG